MSLSLGLYLRLTSVRIYIIQAVYTAMETTPKKWIFRDLANTLVHDAQCLSSLSLLRSMFLRPSLSFFSSHFPKDINSPTEGEVISLVTVKFVQGFEFSVGNNEI